MFRSVRRSLMLLTALAASAGGQASAQVGYGYPSGYGGYGFGGWGGGSSYDGDVARGLGNFAAGLGTYEVDDAVAGSINTDTVIRWNQYMYLSQLQANHNEKLRLRARGARDASAGDAANARAADDVDSGNALNTALDQISDPRVHSSSLRLATAKVPGKIVRAIPFVNASEAVTISLDQLTAENGWPVALRDDQFAPERKAYSEAIDKALKEDIDGDIAPATIKSLRTALSQLKAKLEATPPADKAKFGEAETYLKSLYGMTRMLERPDYEKIIAELDTIKETSLGSLLAFMHTFNLRFGRPTTPEQRIAYQQLYVPLSDLRDRIVKDSGLTAKTNKKAADNGDDSGKDDTPPAPPTPQGAEKFFSGMRLDRLDGPHKYQPKTSQ